MARSKRKFANPSDDAPGLRFSVLTWVTLVYNLIVNIGLPVVAYVFLLPYIVQQVGELTELGPMRALASIMYNNPVAVVLVLPAAVLGLLFPLYGWTKFLVIYMCAEAIAAWVQLSMGVLSLANAAYQLWMFTLYGDHIPGACWLALIAGSLLIIQSILMMLSVIYTKVVYARIKAKTDSVDVLRATNQDSKVLTLVFHAGDFAVHLAFAALFAFIYFADKGFNMDGVNVLKLVTNALVFGNAMFSALVSLTLVMALTFMIMMRSRSPILPAICGIIELALGVLELLAFIVLIVLVAGRTYLKFFGTSEDEIRETPLGAISSFLVLALFKVLPALASCELAVLQYQLHHKLVSEGSRKKGGKYEMHHDVYKLSSML